MSAKHALLRAARRGLALAATVLVLFLLLEAGARFLVAAVRPPIFNLEQREGTMTPYDDAYMWRLKPHVDIEYSGITTNSLGLRSPEVTPKAGRIRVLCIGDSTTFGDDVRDAESWPWQLQAMLDERAPGRFDVVNAGVPGWSSVQGLWYLEQEGLDLAPDIVIVTFGHNDFSYIEKTGGIRDISFISPEASASKLAVLLMRAVQGAELMPTPLEPLEPVRVTPGEMMDAYLRITELATGAGANVIYLYWPFKHEVAAGTPGWQWPLFQTVSAITHQRLVDLTPIFAQAPASLYVDDIHASPEGNRLVAQKLRGLVPHMAPPREGQEQQP